MGQSTAQVAAGKAKAANSPQMSLDELIASMKSLQDDVGQISELSSEEKRVVDVFFDSFFVKRIIPLSSPSRRL